MILTGSNVRCAENTSVTTREIERLRKMEKVKDLIAELDKYDGYVEVSVTVEDDLGHKTTGYVAGVELNKRDNTVEIIAHSI